MAGGKGVEHMILIFSHFGFAIFVCVFFSPSSFGVAARHSG